MSSAGVPHSGNALTSRRTGIKGGCVTVTTIGREGVHFDKREFSTRPMMRFNASERYKFPFPYTGKRPSHLFSQRLPYRRNWSASEDACGVWSWESCVHLRGVPLITMSLTDGRKK